MKMKLGSTVLYNTDLMPALPPHLPVEFMPFLLAHVSYVLCSGIMYRNMEYCVGTVCPGGRKPISTSYITEMCPHLLGYILAMFRFHW
jgi:hypothetical protein